MNQLWEVYIHDRFYSGIIKPSPNHNRLFTKIKQICKIFLRVSDTRYSSRLGFKMHAISRTPGF